MLALYFMDDFFSLDFPFDNFSLQFLEGGVWLFDADQARRVPADAFRRCAASVSVPELRFPVRLEGDSIATQVESLDKLRKEKGLRLVVASEDAQALSLLEARGIETRRGIKAFQLRMVDKMMGADLLFSSMNANGALLEDQIAFALQGRSCLDITGASVKVLKVHHLSIDFSEGEEEGFSIYPDRVELCKFFDVSADYEKANGQVVEQGPLRVRVSATFRMEGEHGYFCIEKLEG